jgi:hypothetical protein
MKNIIKTLLRESLLDEGTIEIPNDVIQKFGVLFDLIKTNLDDYKQKTLNRSYNNPLIAFKDYFKLKDNAGKPLNIDVGLYNDGKDVGAGRMDTITDTVLLNLAFFDYDANTFSALLNHELVHAMDPLVRDKHVFNKYYDKKGAEPSGSKFALSKGDPKSEYDKSYDKYLKSQHEYTANISTLITIIRKVFGKDANKQKWLWWFIENLTAYNKADAMYFGVVEHMEDIKAAKLFKSENDLYSFIVELFSLKPLTADEKSYKKLKNDIYKGLQK